MPKRKTNANFVEFCGGTTADCAAVCCCCPFGLANLLVLVVKVPVGLCRRAILRKRWRKLQKKRRDHGELMRIKSLGITEGFFLEINEVCEDDEKALLKLEEEMWKKFNGTGFWRSPSQKDQEQSTIKEL